MPTSTWNEADRSSARVCVQRLLAAIDAGDSDALPSLFTASPTMFFPFKNTAGLVAGVELIQKRFNAMFDDYRRRGGEPPYVGFGSPEIRVDGSGDASVCTFHYRVGNALGRRSVFLVRAAGGEWRIQHIHGSNMTEQGLI